jgi:hypothetical protein
MNPRIVEVVEADANPFSSLIIEELSEARREKKDDVWRVLYAPSARPALRTSRVFAISSGFTQRVFPLY